MGRMLHSQLRVSNVPFFFSGLPWWTIHNIKGFKKFQAGRRSPVPLYPYPNQYAAYAPSLPPASPSFYPSAYPSPPSYSYSSPSSYPASPPYYYPPSSYPSPAPYSSSVPASSFPTSNQAQQLSYSASSSSPSVNDQYQQQISYPSQLNPSEATSMGNSAAYLMVSGSATKPSNDAKKPKVKPIPPDRTEKFEMKGRCKDFVQTILFFKAIVV